MDGFSIAVSGINAQQQRFDALASDIANADTTGYESSRIDLVDAGAGAGVRAIASGPDPRQAPIEMTGNPLDVAVSGDGYLRVMRPNGQVGLTRAGNLTVDATGRLVTAAGDPLSPTVQLPPGADSASIAISSSGAVTAGGRPVGRIALATVPVPGALAPAGGGVYLPTAASGPIRRASGATLVQGALDASNADPTDGIVGMIETRDAFTASTKVITVQDAMLQSLLGIRT